MWRSLGAGSWSGGRGLRLPGGLGTSRLAGGGGSQTVLLCNISRHSVVYYTDAKSTKLFVDDFKRSPWAVSTSPGGGGRQGAKGVGWCKGAAHLV